MSDQKNYYYLVIDSAIHTNTTNYLVIDITIHMNTTLTDTLICKEFVITTAATTIELITLEIG
jgi:hypothetical protein